MREGVLEVKILEDGQPTAARIQLKDSSGRWRYAPGHLAYVKDRHFTVHGGFTIGLMPGRAHLEIEKGKEYRRISGELDIISGEVVSREYGMERWIDMNELGWYSGDTHVHRSPAEIPHLMEAEDLNVAAVLNFWNQRTIYEWEDFAPERIVRMGNRAFGMVSQEDERSGGAIMGLNLSQPVRRKAAPWHPSGASFAEKWKKQGGTVEEEKPFWWEAPVNVALGLVDTMGIVNNHLQRTEVMENEAWGRPRDAKAYPGKEGFVANCLDLYYRYLNLGIKLPLAAGSASGVLRNPLGGNRLYVNLEKFGYEEWFEGMKLGRAFATNGPMLFIKIGGIFPSQTVKAPGPKDFTVELEARTQDVLERVELISNGRVVESPSCSGGSVKERIVFHAEESCWIAARAFERSELTVRFAHTNPVFLELPEKMIPRATDARYYRDWCRELLRESMRSEGRYESDAGRREVEGRYKRAVAFYEGLLSPAG